MSGRTSCATASPSETPCLAQGEVEGGRLEAPAAVVEVRVLLRLVREERQRREMLREGVQRPHAGKWEIGTAALEGIVLRLRRT